MKQKIIDLFTAWPYCLATYLTLGGIIGLLIVNYPEHLRFIGK